LRAYINKEKAFYKKTGARSAKGDLLRQTLVTGGAAAPGSPTKQRKNRDDYTDPIAAMRPLTRLKLNCLKSGQKGVLFLQLH
jgi:hypothetical protein